MADAKELQQQLERVKRVRRIKALQAQIGEAEKSYAESRTFTGRLKSDAGNAALGLLATATQGFDPAKIAGGSFTQGIMEDYERKQAGLAPEPEFKKILNMSIGPLAANALQAGASRPGMFGFASGAGESIVQDISERPVTGTLEALGLASIGGSAVSRAARFARRPIPKTPLLGYDGPVKGPGFIMSEPAGATESAIAGYRQGRITPSTDLPRLPAPEPMKLLEGPMVGPEGPGQFIARKGPATMFETKQAEQIAKRQAIREAVDLAQSDPTKAAQAFKGLAEKMAGGKLSPIGGAMFKMGDDVPATTATISPAPKGAPTGKVIVAPEKSPTAVEFRNVSLQKALSVDPTTVFVTEIPTGEAISTMQRAAETMTRRSWLSEEAVNRFKGIKKLKRTNINIKPETPEL